MRFVRATKTQTITTVIVIVTISSTTRRNKIAFVWATKTQTITMVIVIVRTKTKNQNEIAFVWATKTQTITTVVVIVRTKRKVQHNSKQMKTTPKVPWHGITIVDNDNSQQKDDKWTQQPTCKRLAKQTRMGQTKDHNNIQTQRKTRLSK